LYLHITGPFLHTQFTIALRILKHAAMFLVQYVKIRWAGHVARMGEGRGVYRDLVRKPEGKRTLGRPRRRWEDNIRMDLQEVGWGV
jgi:hypothetical protein